MSCTEPATASCILQREVGNHARIAGNRKSARWLRSMLARGLLVVSMLALPGLSLVAEAGIMPSSSKDAPRSMHGVMGGSDPTTTQVVSGSSYTCALTSAGAVKCWGINNYGQLGSPTNLGTENANPIPMDVQTLGSGVVAIAAGSSHTCALTNTGAVKCWGLNNSGQLGSPMNSGTDNPNPSPLDVQALGSGVVAIAAGYRHTCALTSAGAVKCWGANYYRQLGSPTNSGTTTANPSPLDVQTLGSGVVAIAAGSSHTCVLTSAGAVKCWGANNYGQLGNPTNSGTLDYNPIPLDVQTLGSGVVAIAVGARHTCALTSAGAVKCWGWNRYGQLGSLTNSGSFTANPSPLDVQTLGSGVVAIAAGYNHTCALTSAGAVKCWGWNDSGQLGSLTNLGTSTANPIPLDVQTLGSGVVAIAAEGLFHTCALTNAGAVKCWGWNCFGQLGSLTNSGTHTANPSPLDVQTLSDIQPASQSIAFDPPASLLRGESLTLSATASSGEDVVFDTWTPDTCTISGHTLTATATQLCGVRASQPGSASFAAAPQQLRLIRIQRNDPLTLNVSGQGSVDVSPDPALGGIDACTQDDSPCTASYADGDAVNLDLMATPATGWHVAGWSGDCIEDALDPLAASVTLDANRTCTATFAINQYTITFFDWDASVLSTQTVNHGDAAAAPANPVRTGYTFTGWDAPFSNVVSDLTITAQYTINQYTVTFLDWEDGVISVQTIARGSAATAPSEPPRPDHFFTGWDTAFDVVMADLTIRPLYRPGVVDAALRKRVSHSLVLLDGSGDLVRFEIVVENIDGRAISDANVLDLLPDVFSPSQWTCEGINSGVCGSTAGTGDIDEHVNLPQGASVRYVIEGRSPPVPDAGIVNIAVVEADDDADTSNNADTARYQRCSGVNRQAAEGNETLLPHQCIFHDGHETP